MDVNCDLPGWRRGYDCEAVIAFTSTIKLRSFWLLIEEFPGPTEPKTPPSSALQHFLIPGPLINHQCSITDFLMDNPGVRILLTNKTDNQRVWGWTCEWPPLRFSYCILLTHSCTEDILSVFWKVFCSRITRIVWNRLVTNHISVSNIYSLTCSVLWKVKKLWPASGLRCVFQSNVALLAASHWFNFFTGWSFLSLKLHICPTPGTSTSRSRSDAMDRSAQFNFFSFFLCLRDTFWLCFYSFRRSNLTLVLSSVPYFHWTRGWTFTKWLGEFVTSVGRRRSRGLGVDRRSANREG